MARSCALWKAGLVACFILIVSAQTITASLLPPRLSTKTEEVRLKEGETGAVLTCNLDVGDDPISYRWLKNHVWVTGALGYAYRGYRELLLALHTVKKHHEGTYICEATNESGVNSLSIRVIVENGDSLMPEPAELPRTDEILSDIATSFSDVLAEGDCACDALFMMHASADAPEETMAAQANLVQTIAESIISKTLRVSVMTYSESTSTKLPFGRGTNRCALREALKDISHPRWSTRIEPVLREIFKRLKKSKSDCKVLFLPIFGSLGLEGIDLIETKKLKKLGVKIFILEVTKKAIPNVSEMASKRGDGQPYHWRIPMHTWPTIVMYMKYMTEELVGCMPEEESNPGCVSIGEACTSDAMCDGMGYGCIDGSCQPLQCNVDSRAPGCCNRPGFYWCGDVTKHCIDKTGICDGEVQCMNGADEDRCWSQPCPEDKVARCQSSTLCLELMDLCDGKPACPGGEDEDPRFCRSFPCPVDRPFRCRSGKCIEKKGLCDGIFKDCEEGEDEDLDYCSRAHVCPSFQPFKCDYGICIPEKMLCDGVYNCLDASDELVCEKRNCPADRPFKCSDNSVCISMDKVCNGIQDGCMDGSDEANCSEIVCPASRSFKCNDGRCIDGWLVCNGRNDCNDGQDEADCTPDITSTTERREPEEPTTTERRRPKVTTTTERRPVVTSTTERQRETCSDGAFQCDTGACIPEMKVCDGRDHCPNGDDEMECEFRECPTNRPHRCRDGTCVVSAPPCNGINDCRDGSDEWDCPVINEPHLPSPEPGYEDYEDDYDEGTVLEEDGTRVEVEEDASENMNSHDHGDDGDMHDVETMLEDAEPENVRPPEASSKEGNSASQIVTPFPILCILAPLLMVNFKYTWMR